MLTLNLPQGTIYCCTQAEAKELWNKEPTKRAGIWLESEVSYYLLASAEKIAECIAAKKNKPGTKVI